MIPHPPIGVLAAMAREIDRQGGRVSAEELRDPKLQQEIAAVAYEQSQEFEKSRGVTQSDYTHWAGELFNALATRLENGT